MKTLHLNLIRCWFDMILTFVKPEEYREITPYWCSRFLLWNGKHMKKEWWDIHLDFDLDCSVELKSFIGHGVITFKKYDTITFSNGYAKDRDQFVIDLKSIEINTGNKELGATPGRSYFVLKLSDGIINLKV